MPSRSHSTDDENNDVESLAPSSAETHRYRTSATVVGLFIDRGDAAKAIDELREAGFSDSEIGIAMQDKADEQALSNDTGISAADGAAKGAIGGGIAGGAIALIASLIPGIGPVIAGGVLGTTLAGLGIGAAGGGIIGALVGLGISKEEAEHFDRRFREGGILVTVGADERAMQARSILRNRGGDLGPSSRDRTSGSAIDREIPVESGASRGWDSAQRDRVEDHWADKQQHAYSGRERRHQRDPSYAGPERRL